MKLKYCCIGDKIISLIVYLLMKTAFLVENDSGIIQIAVIGPHSNYNNYVIPEMPISKAVEESTGVTYTKQQMFVSGRRVNSVPVRQALEELLQFLGDSSVRLIGHNLKSFGCYVLINAAEACGLNDKFSRTINDFIDLNTIVRNVEKKLPSYELEDVVKHFLRRDAITHDATEDVFTLKRLYQEIGPDAQMTEKATFDYEYIVDAKTFTDNKKKNLPDWQPLIKNSVFPKGAAEKAAGHGMTVQGLLAIYQEGGEEKLLAVLSEEDKNTHKPKVTDKKGQITQLSKHFSKMGAK